MPPSKNFDPLATIPGPDFLRSKCAEVELYLARLRILLEVSEKIRDAEPTTTGKKHQVSSTVAA